MPISLRYSSKLFEFNISEISEFCDQEKNNSRLNNTIAKALERFPECFNSYFNIQPPVPSEGKIKILEYVILTNDDLIRVTNLFHSHPWFSNVSIVMDSKELFDEKYQSDSENYFAQVCII